MAYSLLINHNESYLRKEQAELLVSKQDQLFFVVQLSIQLGSFIDCTPTVLSSNKTTKSARDHTVTASWKMTKYTLLSNTISTICSIITGDLSNLSWKQEPSKRQQEDSFKKFRSVFFWWWSKLMLPVLIFPSLKCPQLHWTMFAVSLSALKTVDDLLMPFCLFN